MNNDIAKVLFTQDQIEQRLDQLAADLTAKYQDQFPVVVSVMTGATIFTVDMIKRLNFKLNLDYLDVSSYQNGSESAGQIQLNHDLSYDIKVRPVIIMEDIIDTGYTLKYLRDLLQNRGAKSIEICTLLDKPERRKVDVKADRVGFKVPNEFIVGYGLDYAGLYRNLPYIGILKKEVYAH